MIPPKTLMPLSLHHFSGCDIILYLNSIKGELLLYFFIGRHWAGESNLIHSPQVSSDDIRQNLLWFSLFCFCLICCLAQKYKFL